jgi:hypothetical protein
VERMSITDWERTNGKLVIKIEQFLEKYEAENKDKFIENYPKACRDMAKASGRVFKKEIDEQITGILVLKQNGLRNL